MNVRSISGGAQGISFKSLNREVYDAQNKSYGMGKLVRTEGAEASKDADINAAYDNSGIVHDFYKEVFGRDSIDGKGMKLKSVVHFGKNYANAFWDGEKMTYGDGDGRDFGPLARGLDVVGHELSHGVTEHSANLEYRDQPGALNESFSDVFGEVIEQWSENKAAFGTIEGAKQADWLIGEDVFTPKTPGDALRSMKNPGKAYPGDPQPAHMRDYKNMSGDNGGVHYNSGIPNKAAYEAAMLIGSEKLAHVWYDALTTRMASRSSFSDAAKATVASAAALYDTNTAQSVSDAWKAVGIVAPVGSETQPPVIDRETHRDGQGFIPAYFAHTKR